MNYKHNIIKERFDLQVPVTGAIVKEEFELDKNAEFLIGIAVTSDQEQLLYYRGSQKIEVNDQELLPEDFETKLLMTSTSVPPNQRMVKVEKVKTGNGKVTVWYKDTDHPAAPFAPYRVTFYFISHSKIQE